MLEGITILNEFTANIFNWDVSIIVFFVTALIGSIAFFIIAAVSEEDAWLSGIIISVLIGLIIGAGCGSCFFANEETQYQVTISEEVSMTEFNERYEIVEQNGQIFTIKEKNKNVED